jgi:hypothetical protein
MRSLCRIVTAPKYKYMVAKDAGVVAVAWMHGAQ